MFRTIDLKDTTVILYLRKDHVDQYRKVGILPVQNSLVGKDFSWMLITDSNDTIKSQSYQIAAKDISSVKKAKLKSSQSRNQMSAKINISNILKWSKEEPHIKPNAYFTKIIIHVSDYVSDDDSQYSLPTHTETYEITLCKEN